MPCRLRRRRRPNAGSVAEVADNPFRKLLRGKQKLCHVPFRSATPLTFALFLPLFRNKLRCIAENIA